MLGMAELMRVAYEKGDLASVQDRLAFLITDAEHLALSIADILALTTLQAEPTEAACERFDIVALMHEVSEAGRSIAGDKPLTVMDVSCASSVMIHSDQARVKQLMMRLMSNAVKFTDRGRIALILSEDTDEIRLTVADTGRGMAREQINAVLDSSEYGYDVEMNGFATSGLWLRLVKALVKQLHGSLSIASKTGEGTIVAVSLPVSQPRK
jgi:cell cycle sensor histidine kinase DivJ